MTRARVAGLALLCLGCVTPVTLVHDGPANLEQDKWDCSRDLGVLGVGSGASSSQQIGYLATSFKADLLRCLALKGWHPQP